MIRRERYICRAIDAPLPTVETFCLNSLNDWRSRHPSIPLMSHDLELSTTRITEAGRQETFRLMIVNVYYEQ